MARKKISMDGNTAAATYSAKANDVLEAASYMKANMDARVLPTTVTIGDMSCTNEQFLDLACKLVVNIEGGSPNSDLSFSKVSSPSSPSGTAEGTVMKADYLGMARSIIANIASSGRVPSDTTATIGKMQHSYCVYMFAFILDYYVRYGMLPESYAVMTWAGSTGSPIAPAVPGVSAFDTATATTLL